jgi:hypothetical protein
MRQCRDAHGVSLRVVETALLSARYTALFVHQMRRDSPRFALWPNPARSSTNSALILRRKTTSTTYASNYARPLWPSRRMSKKSTLSDDR